MSRPGIRLHQKSPYCLRLAEETCTGQVFPCCLGKRDLCHQRNNLSQAREQECVNRSRPYAHPCSLSQLLPGHITGVRLICFMNLLSVLSGYRRFLGELRITGWGVPRVWCTLNSEMEIVWWFRFFYFKHFTGFFCHDLHHFPRSQLFVYGTVLGVAESW